MKTIRFAHFPTPFGEGFIAASDKGVCALHVGVRERTFTFNLMKSFLKAAIKKDVLSLLPTIQQLQSYLNGEARSLHIDTDLYGTAFQKRVWKGIMTIPYGETITYKELAIKIGKSGRATRAVGNAVAVNNVALVVPCHRVVRQDGDLGGFRWGLGMKEKLLEMESLPQQADRADTSAYWFN